MNTHKMFRMGALALAFALSFSGCQTLPQGRVADDPGSRYTKKIPLIVKHGPPPSRAGIKEVVVPGVENTFNVTLPATAPHSSVTMTLKAYQGTVVTTSGSNIGLQLSSTPVTDWFASGSDFTGNKAYTFNRGAAKRIDFELDPEWFNDEEIDDTYLVILARQVETYSGNDYVYDIAYVFAVDSPYQP